jgi:hypothetical protein
MFKDFNLDFFDQQNISEAELVDFRNFAIFIIAAAGTGYALAAGCSLVKNKIKKNQNKTSK